MIFHPPGKLPSHIFPPESDSPIRSHNLALAETPATPSTLAEYYDDVMVTKKGTSSSSSSSSKPKPTTAKQKPPAVPPEPQYDEVNPPIPALPPKPQYDEVNQDSPPPLPIPALPPKPQYDEANRDSPPPIPAYHGSIIVTEDASVERSELSSYSAPPPIPLQRYDFSDETNLFS